MKSLAVLLLASLALAAQTGSKPPRKPPLPSTVFDWDKLVVTKTANGERRNIVDQPTATVTNFESHVTTLEAGKIAHAPHRHPDEEIVIVKEGTVEVTINGTPQTAGVGSMFFFASNDLHGMRNVGAGRATYFVIRAITAATPKPVIAAATPAQPAPPK